MDLNVRIEQYYPHPIEKVWQAITSREGLAAWLMAGDFEAIVGRRFTFKNCPDAVGSDLVTGEVIELIPPTRMVWHWCSSPSGKKTEVRFELVEAEGGTLLTLSHAGPIEDDIGQDLTSGWPVKLEALGDQLQ